MSKYLAYFPESSPKSVQLFAGVQLRSEKIPSIRFFLARYKAYPCVLTCPQADSNILFHISSVLNYLKTEFGYDENNDLILRKYHKEAKQFFAICRLCDLGNGIMIYIQRIYLISDIENPNKYSPDFLDDYFLVSQSILIYYMPENELKVQNLAQEFLTMSVFESKLLKLNLICRHQQAGYYLSVIDIKKPIIYDLALHYGDDFVNIHKKILKELNKKEGKGIVLLHGIPGCGKTHYIRYLIEEIQEKKLIYVPPDMAKDISKPDFLTFLLQHSNSILIIEDAENIIRDRDEITLNTTQAVANILNLSDGLLGDAMHIQIIATFNCDLTIIDKALLRKGRLIANYEFGKLNVNKAKILSEKLGFGMEQISAPMTLAEIYNQNKNNEIGEIV